MADTNIEQMLIISHSTFLESLATFCMYIYFLALHTIFCKVFQYNFLCCHNKCTLTSYYLIVQHRYIFSRLCVFYWAIIFSWLPNPNILTTRKCKLLKNYHIQIFESHNGLVSMTTYQSHVSMYKFKTIYI